MIKELGIDLATAKSQKQNTPPCPWDLGEPSRDLARHGSCICWSMHNGSKDLPFHT